MKERNEVSIPFTRSILRSHVVRHNVRLLCFTLALAAAGLHAADSARDFYAEGMAALDAKNVPQAVSLLSQVPEDDPHFAEAMIEAGRDLLAEDDKIRDQTIVRQIKG